jgi:hypothetical protein
MRAACAAPRDPRPYIGFLQEEVMPRRHVSHGSAASGPARLDKTHLRAIAIATKLIHSDRAMARAIARYAKLSRRKRRGLARFIRFCQQRTTEERAKFVLWQRPDLTDAEIARVIGVRRETISRLDSYRAFKNRLLEVARPLIGFKSRGRTRKELRIYDTDRVAGRQKLTQADFRRFSAGQ